VFRSLQAKNRKDCEETNRVSEQVHFLILKKRPGLVAQGECRVSRRPIWMRLNISPLPFEKISMLDKHRDNPWFITPGVKAGTVFNTNSTGAYPPLVGRDRAFRSNLFCAVTRAKKYFRFNPLRGRLTYRP
jgi:hypothetical protein